MKIKSALTLAALALLAGANRAAAQGTAFTYQGQLMESGDAANGAYDLRFYLYNASSNGSIVAGPLTNSATAVSNGLFTVTLDFGDVFEGTNFWLHIGVRTNGTANFTALDPRQQLTPTPYAIFANTSSNLAGNLPASQLSGTVSSANLAGTYRNAVTLDNAANQISGSFTGNGANVTNVNAAALNGLQAANFWQTAGNSGTSAGVNFAGTVDNQPFEIHVNGLRALRLEPTANNANISNALNVIQGSPANYVLPGVQGATIGGGGAPFYFGYGTSNSVADNFDTIGGGVNNHIQSNAFESTISGGNGNSILSGAMRSTIAGGWANTIASDHSFIAGGVQDTIQVASSYSAIGGGAANLIETNDEGATIAGGYDNVIEPGSGFSAVCGGWGNIIQADSSFCFIGSGFENGIETNNFYATMAGGSGNTIQPGSGYSFIGGGESNIISSDSSWSSIAGGYGNIASGNSATVGGGNGNTASASFATVCGGIGNIASGTYATLLGGDYNIASGPGAMVLGGNGDFASGIDSLAAGTAAQAAHDGAFVWADDSPSYFSSTAANGFFVRCTGGVKFVTGIDSSGNATAGVKVNSGGTSWTTICDRNAKKNFQPVDTVAVLNKLAAIPIQRWNYRWEANSDTPNLGPMAQDFKAAFYPGRDDKGITTLEFDGVELAAIQGLNQKVEELKDELSRRDAENAELKQRLAALEKIILGQKSNGKD